MEYYSAFKRKEILTHAATGMNLEDITLSERNEAQKDKYCYDSSYVSSETEGWLSGAGVNGELFSGYRLSVL